MPKLEGKQVNPVFKDELYAEVKHFCINHPTLENKKLVYGTLEGPEYGVYFRGKGQGSRIHLPEIWKNLVHEDSITVTVTPIGRHISLCVDSQIDSNVIRVFCEGAKDEHYEYFFIVMATRKDQKPLMTVRNSSDFE